MRSHDRPGLNAVVAVMAVCFASASVPATAQSPPNRTEIRAYKSLFSSVIRGELTETQRLLASGADPNMRDDHGRTPLIVAAHRSVDDIARALVKGGADVNAKDSQQYDILTIAAVNDDIEFLRLALELGANPKAITSPYDGTALIAAAHLGHYRVVADLIRAGAPLNHVNNIAMTALIESIVLGNGGVNHIATLQLLLDAGANPNIPDRSGASPLQLAQSRGYLAMVDLIRKAGGK